MEVPESHHPNPDINFRIAKIVYSNMQSEAS